MPPLIVADQPIATDPQGYLVNLNDWTNEVALAIAARENIILTKAHWLIIEYLRTFYQQYQTTPPLRLWVKYLIQQGQPEIANSIALHQLFPGGPPKQASKIAGLPKPTRCI